MLGSEAKTQEIVLVNSLSTDLWAYENVDLHMLCVSFYVYLEKFEKSNRKEMMRAKKTMIKRWTENFR